MEPPKECSKAFQFETFWVRSSLNSFFFLGNIHSEFVGVMHSVSVVLKSTVYFKIVVIECHTHLRREREEELRSMINVLRWILFYSCSPFNLILMFQSDKFTCVYCVASHTHATILCIYMSLQYNEYEMLNSFFLLFF